LVRVNEGGTEMGAERGKRDLRRKTRKHPREERGGGELSRSPRREGR
jgi:hypothetical protein